MSFFVMPYNMGPYPAGRDFKMVYFPLNLRIITSVYINHFETFRRAHVEPPTNLSYIRPALARSLWNIIRSLYYFSAEFYLLMPYKPGLGQGPPWRDMHGISRYCCNVLEVPRPELRPCKRGLGQGHNQKKDTHTLKLSVTILTNR